MRHVALLCGMIGIAFQGWAQQDSTKPTGSGDTVRVGGIIIINKDGGNSGGGVYMDSTGRKHQYSFHSHGKIKTTWLNVDLGFDNYVDKTNYASSATQALSPGATADRFALRTGKSINFNLWFVKQKVSLYKNYINLQYALGLESYNFRYTNSIIYRQNPLQIVNDTINFKKNKLATDFLTVPFMINIDFNPHHENIFGISFGMSAGYLYDSRQKFISSEFGKQKTHSSFNLQPWRYAYVAEVDLGIIGIYGSFATTSMYKYGLDMTPYAVGVRLNY